MKKLTDYSAPILKAWTIHEALRRLGFLPREVYMSAYREPIDGVLAYVFGCILQTQDKEFIVSCGAYRDAAGVEHARVEWDEFREQIHEHSEEALREVFEGSEVWGKSADFVLTLRKKGFMFPYDKN